MTCPLFLFSPLVCLNLRLLLLTSRLLNLFSHTSTHSISQSTLSLCLPALITLPPLPSYLALLPPSSTLSSYCPAGVHHSNRWFIKLSQCTAMATTTALAEQTIAPTHKRTRTHRMNLECCTSEVTRLPVQCTLEVLRAKLMLPVAHGLSNRKHTQLSGIVYISIQAREILCTKTGYCNFPNCWTSIFYHSIFIKAHLDFYSFPNYKCVLCLWPNWTKTAQPAGSLWGLYGESLGSAIGLAVFCRFIFYVRSWSPSPCSSFHNAPRLILYATCLQACNPQWKHQSVFTHKSPK